MTKETKTKIYDLYIVCGEDDLKWENEMATALEEMGHSVYSRRKFRPGGYKPFGIFHGINNCKVLVIGFGSPSKKKNDVPTFLIASALEVFKFNENLLIPISLSKDAIIPEELCAINAVPYGTSNSEIICGISRAIKSLKSEMDTKNGDNTTGHTKTSKAACSTSKRKIEWKQCKKFTHEQENQVPKAKKVCIMQEEGRRVMQPLQPSIANRVIRVSESSNREYYRDGQIKRDSYQRTYDTHTGS